MGAIPVHHTETSDKPWSKGPNVKRLKEGDKAAYRKTYAWVDSEGDDTVKASYKFPHHEVSESGDPGAANVEACHSIVSILNGGMGGSSIPSEDRQGVYNHAKAHLEDAGEKEIAPLKSESEIVRKSAMKSYSHMAARVFGRVHAIRTDKLDEIVAYLKPRFEGQASFEAYGPGDPKDKKEYCVTSDGIAVIPVCGTLVKNGGWMSAFSGLTSYDCICANFRDAMCDPSIRGILFDIDSPGGEVSGLFDLVDEIYASRGTKPIYAFSNDSAFSAAYAIASAADKIYVEKYTGGVGSIGVIALHCDESEADKKAGLKYTAIYAGDHKNDGSPHEPLSDSALANLQAEVDRIYNVFVATVARNRGVAQQKVVNTEAGLYFAQQGIPLLADKLATRDQVMKDMLAAIEGGEPALGISGASSESGIVVHVDTSKARAQLNDLLALAQSVDEKIKGISAVGPDKAAAAETGIPESEPQTQTEESADMAKETPNAVAGEVDEELIVGAANRADATDDEQDDENMPSANKNDADDEDDDEEDDDDDDDEQKPKKRAKSAKKKGNMSESKIGVSDIKQISMLCTLAGVPEKLAEFIQQEASVEQVQKALLEMRSKKQAPGISSHAAVNANANSFENLARRAASNARSEGKTKERAITDALLANPEAYEHFLEVEKPQFEALCRANRDRSRSYQVVQG